MLRILKQYVSRVTIHMAKLVIASVLSCAGLNVAFALDFSKISQLIFFGDSLTDGGFNDLWPTIGNPPTRPPLPAGKQPTFTTFGGHIWSQIVAHDIKGFRFPVYPGPSVPDRITNNAIEFVPGFVSGTLRGINYAAAGSSTNSIGFDEFWAPSLHRQVAFYLASIPIGQRLDPNAVYFIWAGANDFLLALFSGPPPTQLDLIKTANQAAKNIAGEVALLSSRGARWVVVISLPNLGLTPLARNTPVPNFPATLKNISFTFNSMLNQQLGQVIKRYGTKILYIDFYSLLGELVTKTQAGKPFMVAGQAFQFANATTPACTAPSAIYCEQGAPNNFVFADQLHPTGMTHEVIALEVETMMRSWH